MYGRRNIDTRHKTQELPALAAIADCQLPTADSSRGIVLIALGSTHYGRMAANCAASIRQCDPHVNIHLVYTPSAITHLTDAHRALFSSIAECPAEYYTKNGQTVFIKAKTCIYELSPFKETLLLDVDLVLFGRRPVSDLLEDLNDTEFTMQCRGWFDFDTGTGNNSYTHWCDKKMAQQAYGLKGRMYQLSSEVIFFKRSAQNEALFKLVREVFDNPKVVADDKFQNDIPDELAFNIATCKLGIAPRKETEVFIYWAMLDKKTAWTDILNSHYGYSIGGNYLTPTAANTYNQLAKGQATGLGLPYHYKVYPKRQWDAGRKQL